jgi:hypothetical protein
MTTVRLVAFDWPLTVSLSIGLMAHSDISDRARSDRLGVIRAELLERMRPVCRAMPQELFIELVEGMAAVQLKYELRDGNGEAVEQLSS